MGENTGMENINKNSRLEAISDTCNLEHYVVA
jgi:hypothetical protein